MACEDVRVSDVYKNKPIVGGAHADPVPSPSLTPLPRAHAVVAVLTARFRAAALLARDTPAATLRNTAVPRGGA